MLYKPEIKKLIRQDVVPPYYPITQITGSKVKLFVTTPDQFSDPGTGILVSRKLVSI